MTEYFSERRCRIIKEEDTFFNPAQKLNRDISIEVIKEFFPSDKRIRILGAMSATGIREIRYLQEIENSQIFFNDISNESLETIQKNLRLNGFDSFKMLDVNDLKKHNLKDLFYRGGKSNCMDSDDMTSCIIKDKEILKYSNIYDNRIIIAQSDCRVLMSKYEGCFDVIDIDPFGSSAPFVNDAFKAIRHNGLLFLTCTDKASLCSNEKKCFIRYGSKIKRNYAKNEIAVRTLLSFISREMSKYDASIVPILSLSVDFYVRVIVQVKKNNGKSVIVNNSYSFICECLNNRMQEINGDFDSVCEVCNKRMKLYGLFWNRSLYDKKIIEKIIKRLEIEKEISIVEGETSIVEGETSIVEGNKNILKNECNKSECNISNVKHSYKRLRNKQLTDDRLIGILRLMQQEIDYCFYYELPMLTSKLKVNSCKLREIMNALAHCGYEVSLVYYDNNSIKTNAPLKVINEIMENKENNKYNYGSHEQVDQIFEKKYFKGQISSGLRPLSLPTKK